MTISSINGVLKINGKEVLAVVFSNGETMRFPTDDANEIIIQNGADENTAAVFGNRNTVIQGKNIISPGSSIKCGGDFRLGDG